jgi:hypothetical protein
MPYSLDIIRKSCPAINQGLIDETVGITTSQDEWEIISREAKAECRIPVQIKENAGITGGCRYVTKVSSTGCPLRDRLPVKVSTG